jgi:hypothetical protein
MLMRGDLQKIFDHINPVLDNAFKKIEVLEKEIEKLKAQKEVPKKEKQAA